MSTIARHVRRLLVRFDSMPKSQLSLLDFSLDPKQTIGRLRRHKWRKLDLHYAFLAFLLTFAFCIAEANILFKVLFAGLLTTLLLVPVLSQFFFPFLPIATWLIFFFSARFIPAAYRPPISVRVLPALENILYGANLSNILAKHTNSVLDVLGWLPYGVIHFGAPFVCSAIMWAFGPPLTVPVFATSFGYMNIIGVIIQILFPCSPPWYENLYGLAPANYGMPGSPGGLARIDKLFGGDTYTTTFTASPMVFGAFPSLHSGSATIEALFLAHCFPRFRRYFFAYVLWIWWSTMYLTHHYFVDLIGGSMLAASCYYVARRYFLPRVDPNKLTRFEYETVTLGVPSGDWLDRVDSRRGGFSRLATVDDDEDLDADFGDDVQHGRALTTANHLNDYELDEFELGAADDESDFSTGNDDEESRVGISAGRGGRKTPSLRASNPTTRRSNTFSRKGSRLGSRTSTSANSATSESEHDYDHDDVPTRGSTQLSRQSSVTSTSSLGGVRSAVSSGKARIPASGGLAKMHSPTKTGNVARAGRPQPSQLSINGLHSGAESSEEALTPTSSSSYGRGSGGAGRASKPRPTTASSSDDSNGSALSDMTNTTAGTHAATTTTTTTTTNANAKAWDSGNATRPDKSRRVAASSPTVHGARSGGKGAKVALD